MVRSEGLGPDITSVESGDKKLAYNNEFRQMLREHTGIIKTAVELADKAANEYHPADAKYGIIELRYNPETRRWEMQRERHIFGEDGKFLYSDTGEPLYEPSGWEPFNYGRGVILAPDEPVTDETSGLTITTLGRSNRELPQGMPVRAVIVDDCDYFKMQLEDDAFFVKRSFITINPGFTEFRNTVQASELLKDLDFVHVVSAQLGYQDDHQSWYVSKWVDMESAGFAMYDDPISDYGTIVERAPKDAREWFLGFETEEEYRDVKQKADLITERLKSAHLALDVDANLFYSRQTKTFILFDVTAKNGEILGEAIKRV